MSYLVKIDVKLVRIEDNFFKTDSIYAIESEIEGEKFAVERRMKEFQNLWDLLKEIYPSQIIPPLPEKIINRENGREFNQKCSLLKLALESAFDHEILKQDEYLKSFLLVENFSDCVHLIKNVEAPVQVKKEYFKGKWSFSNNLIRDHRVTLKVDELKALKDKLKQLIPIFDRFNYESGQVKRAAEASEQSTRHLLLLTTANEKGIGKVSQFLKGISAEQQNDKNEIVYFMNFSIKYIEYCDFLMDKLNRFTNYLNEKREKVSELAKKLDQIQMPKESKPSFDLIYQTKLKHERLLEEIAIIEINYEKFSDLIEKELNWIFYWIKINFKSKLHETFNKQ